MKKYLNSDGDMELDEHPNIFYFGAVLGMGSYKLDPYLSPLLLLDHDKSLLQVIDFVSEPIVWWFESTSFLYVHIYI